ncbi:MAG: DUF362 domain-containing protein [Candidatus Bathyarchaeia archaeon]|jgi:uncharacterized protein (DUF362 family)
MRNLFCPAVEFIVRWAKLEKVSIVMQPSYEHVEQAIASLAKQIDVNDLGDRDRIVIKPNILGLRTPETGAITHPIFLDGLLSWLRKSADYRREILVVESDSTAGLQDIFADWFGFTEVLKRWNVRFVNLSQAVPGLKIQDGVLKGQEVPELFQESFFITLAKLKTHMKTKISCALKNQFGCIPSQRKIRFHKFLDEAIVEANKYFRPNLCIVDGIIALTGVQGPDYGLPVRAGITLSSKDPVACDSVCAKLLGFRPSSVRHIKLSEKAGIGSILNNPPGLDDIRIGGRDRLEAFTFQVANVLKSIS